MNTDVVFCQILAFFAAFLLVNAVAGLRRDRREAGPAKEFAARPVFFNWFAREIAFLASVLGRYARDETAGDNPKVLRQIRLAGYDGLLTCGEIRGAQLLLALAALVVGGLTLFIFGFTGLALVGWGLGAGYLGWAWPAIWLQQGATARQDKISKALPFAVDLMTVAMQSGQDLRAALRHLVDQAPFSPLIQEFGLLLRQIDAGKTWDDAFREMAERIQLDEFRVMVTAILQGFELGASISDTLRLHAEEIRRNRFHKAEQKAARAPSLMVLPIVLCILPGIFIVILTPMAIKLMANFGS